jgi:hypothetical protein
MKKILENFINEDKRLVLVKAPAYFGHRTPKKVYNLFKQYGFKPKMVDLAEDSIDQELKYDNEVMIVHNFHKDLHRTLDVLELFIGNKDIKKNIVVITENDSLIINEERILKRYTFVGLV